MNRRTWGALWQGPPHVVFGRTGDSIEQRLGDSWTRPTGADVGRVRDDIGAVEGYVATVAG